MVTGSFDWMLPYHDRMPAVLQQAVIDRWLRGDMSTDELHLASETGARPNSLYKSIGNLGNGAAKRCAEGIADSACYNNGEGEKVVLKSKRLFERAPSLVLSRHVLARPDNRHFALGAQMR